jgi:hypothetical protein
LEGVDRKVIEWGEEGRVLGAGDRSEGTRCGCGNGVGITTSLSVPNAAARVISVLKEVVVEAVNYTTLLADVSWRTPVVRIGLWIDSGLRWFVVRVRFGGVHRLEVVEGRWFIGFRFRFVGEQGLDEFFGFGRRSEVRIITEALDKAIPLFFVALGRGRVLMGQLGL